MRTLISSLESELNLQVALSKLSFIFQSCYAFEVGLKVVLGNIVWDKFIKIKSALKICSLEEINYVVLSGKLIYFFFYSNTFPLGLTVSSFGYTHQERPRLCCPTHQWYTEQSMGQWLNQSVKTEIMFLCCVLISRSGRKKKFLLLCCLQGNWTHNI